MNREDGFLAFLLGNPMLLLSAALGIALVAAGVALKVQSARVATAKADAVNADSARQLCLGKLDGWIAVAAEQNQAVEKLRADSARRLGLAAQAAKAREAEAEARGREAGALAALSASPAADGDESCDAADREIVRRLGP